MSENLPVDVRQKLEAQAAAMVKKIGAPGGDKIAVTRKKTFKLPGGEECDRLRVVVLDFVAYNAFYDRQWTEGDKTPPACFALANEPKHLAPSENSPDKQYETCTGCPNNEFGSKGKGKACGNHRLLAVVEPTASADAPILLLRTSPTAVKHWDAYVSRLLSQHKKIPIEFSTEIYFDPDDDFPTLRFGDEKPNANIGVHMARQDQATKRLMTEPDVSSYEAPTKVKTKGPKK